jgi:hypothetical protein
MSEPDTVAAEMPMRNGIFLAPFHPTDRDPTEALQRDFELIEALDRSPRPSAPSASSWAPGWRLCPTIIP